jgi:hypothetical protein
VGRYKTRGQKAQDSLIKRYMNLRRAMVEIRDILGMTGRTQIEDIVEEVRKLAGKKREDHGADQNL